MNQFYENRKLKIVKAVYKAQDLSRYKGIPYIEVLPPRMSQAEFFQIMENPIPYDPSEKLLPFHIRCDGPFILSSWFLTQGCHHEIYMKCDSMLREGYYHSAQRINRNYSLTPLGGYMVAPSGTGKTSGTGHCFQIYPDIIIHDPDHFTDCREFQQYQIPVLMINAPYDGKVKGIEEAIIDSLKYLVQEQFGITIDDRRDIRYLLRDFKVGLLVIDEIPFLLQSKEDNYEVILNYLVYLRTRLCIPVMFIGTPDIMKIFENYPSQKRKIIGPGSVKLLPMFARGREEDGSFRLSAGFIDFMEEMWEYQWIQEATEAPSEDILQAFYQCTAGIRDYIVKLFQLVQIRLIHDHEKSESTPEIITPDLIYEIADLEFKIVNDEIRKLAKNPASADEIQDMGLEKLPDITELAESYKVKSEEAQDKKFQNIRKNITREKALVKKLEAEGIEEDRAQLLAKSIIIQYPDAKDLLRKALNLDADPEFDKTQAPYIKRREDVVITCNPTLFRSCYAKSNSQASTYENLKLKGLITNLRDS